MIETAANILLVIGGLITAYMALRSVLPVKDDNPVMSHGFGITLAGLAFGFAGALMYLAAGVMEHVHFTF